MLLATIALLAVSAIFGITMVARLLNNQTAPNISVVLHGILNVVAIVLVVIAVSTHEDSQLTTALIVFLIAAVGGAALFYLDKVKKRIPPKFLVILHPVIGLAGVVLLVMYVLK